MVLKGSHIIKISLGIAIATLICASGIAYVDEVSERSERNEAPREVILSSTYSSEDDLNKKSFEKTSRPKAILTYRLGSLFTIFSGFGKYNIDFIYHTTFLD